VYKAKEQRGEKKQAKPLFPLISKSILALGEVPNHLLCIFFLSFGELPKGELPKVSSMPKHIISNKERRRALSPKTKLTGSQYTYIYIYMGLHNSMV
jgi:hypothetical protein